MAVEISLSSRVKIMAVGVENYQHMRPLYGPGSDLDNLYDLFVKSPKTALFDESQFIKILNPSLDDLNNQINSYTLERSANGDILLFYFSGHGVSLRNSDFGFCTTDTIIHPGSNVVLPLTVLKFSDLLESLTIHGVTPVVVIDACYSGVAGDVLIPSHDAIVNIRQGLTRLSASNYALLCSCSQYETSQNSPEGGVFSKLLFDNLSNGIPEFGGVSQIITLKELYKPLLDITERQGYDAIPRLFFGETLPDFPIVKNVNFLPQKSQTYSFTGHLYRVIDALWNNGNIQELSPGQILKLCGNGAYGNHQKLSLDPWSLVENVPNTKMRRLTGSGKLFAQGKIKIPKTIEKNLHNNQWQPVSGAVEIDFLSFQENQS